VNYAKLLEMNSFFTLHSFLEVGKTQDLPSKFWQTLGAHTHFDPPLCKHTPASPLLISTVLQNTPRSLIPARGARPLTHRFLSRSTQTVESGKEKKARSGKDKK
jgi:hypothetical protein